MKGVKSGDTSLYRLRDPRNVALNIGVQAWHVIVAASRASAGEPDLHVLTIRVALDDDGAAGVADAGVATAVPGVDEACADVIGCDEIGRDADVIAQETRLALGDGDDGEIDAAKGAHAGVPRSSVVGSIDPVSCRAHEKAGLDRRAVVQADDIGSRDGRGNLDDRDVVQDRTAGVARVLDESLHARRLW